MEDKTKVIQALASELIQKLGFKATVEVMHDENVYTIRMTTDDDASMLIGKHARMLADLQRVLGAMLFKKLGEAVDVLVDVNDYRIARKNVSLVLLTILHNECLKKIVLLACLLFPHMSEKLSTSISAKIISLYNHTPKAKEDFASW